MASKEKLPIGHGSSLISFAKENLRKDKRTQKLIKRKLIIEEENQEEVKKVNPNSNYKVRRFYKNGGEKIIPGSALAEGPVPVNIKETKEMPPLNIQKSPSFLQKIKKIFQNAQKY
jgi:hypothetical protein